jgi:hypothetical protein
MQNNINKDIGYIGHEELVFNKENGIQSGGFCVSSIMQKVGMSPIVTMNVNTGQNGGSNNVSDLFQNLAVPNWATMYNMQGGEYKEKEQNKKHVKDDSDSDIDDDLHDKLLDLVKEHESKVNKKTKTKTKRKNNTDKKNTTKRRKNNKKEEKI